MPVSFISVLTENMLKHTQASLSQSNTEWPWKIPLKKKPEMFCSHFIACRVGWAQAFMLVTQMWNIFYFSSLERSGNSTKFIKYLPFSNVTLKWLWNWRKYFLAHWMSFSKSLLYNFQWHVGALYHLKVWQLTNWSWNAWLQLHKLKTNRKTFIFDSFIAWNFSWLARVTINFNLMERLNTNEVQLKPIIWQYSLWSSIDNTWYFNAFYYHRSCSN